MASNITEVNDAVNIQNFYEVLLVTLKSKVDEVKQLKDHVRALERKLALSEHKDCVCYTRKQSNPEIFRFPAPKFDALGTKDSSVTAGTEHRNAEIICDTTKVSEEVWNLVDCSKEPALVPEQDFKNAINELIKTKTLLHNIQKNQRDMKKLEAEKLHSPKQIAPLKDGRFELGEDLSQILDDSNEHSSLSLSVTLKAEVDELKLLNKTLKQENMMKTSNNLDLVKKVKTMQKEIDGLNENIKTLSVCLQEEKIRSSKAVSDLNSLKLTYEKNAMEKARGLEQRSGMKYSSNPGGRTFSSEAQHSGTFNSSSELPVVGTSPRAAPPNGPYNIMPDLRQARPATQNNLSPQPFEKKPSNLPQTPSSIRKCPRCFAEFDEDEDAFMKHLHRCINCE